MAGQQDRPGAVETANGDLAQRMERLPPGHPSSPYNEDGTRKPPVARSADRELPLPEEQAADAESAVPAPRQSDEPDQRSVDTQDLTNKDRASPETARRDAADHETGDGEIRPGETPGADAEDSPARGIGPASPDATRPDSRSWWRHFRISRNSGNATKNAGPRPAAASRP